MIETPSAVSFSLTENLRREFEALRPPFQVRHKPSPELLSFFRNARSYFRFLGLLSEPLWSEGRFSMVLSRVMDGSEAPVRVPVDGGSFTVLSNLSQAGEIELNTGTGTLSIPPLKILAVEVPSLDNGSWTVAHALDGGRVELLVASWRRSAAREA